MINISGTEWFIDASRQRGREGRLVRLVSDTKDLDIGTSYGIGIDEDTALHLTIEEEVINAEVLGTNGIFFCDLRNATFDHQ